MKDKRKVKAKRIVERCRVATVPVPEWVRFALNGPKKKGEKR